MSMILFRTHKFGAEARAFYEQLRAESGLEVVCLVDETRSPVDVSPFPKVSLTRDAFRSHGLLVTSDAAWRCGDYGLYLAMHERPNIEFFWLIEYDVRIKIDGPLSKFFLAFDASRADLIAPMLTERDPSWWWTPAMQVRNEPVWGCLFPVLRVSSSLLRVAYSARQRQARSPIYRLFWPNDESFLATTAARNSFKMEDLNEFKHWYSSQTFSFEQPWSGESLSRARPDDLIYHPVLYDEELVKKLGKVAKPSTFSEVMRRRLRKLLRRVAV